MTGPLSFQIDRDRLGPPGIEGYLHIVDELRDDSWPAEKRLADRSPRVFRVRAVLAKAHSQIESVRCGIAPGEGGCFITSPDDLHIQTPNGTYDITRNSRGELAIAARSVTATQYEEAFETFLADVTPSFDHLSYLSNTPIVVDLIEARDEANHITIVTYRTPYGNVQLSDGGTQLFTPLFTVYALYREAMSATSNFYKFLCFFKIFEGIYGKIRPHLFRLAKEQNINISKVREVVPDHPELRGDQPSYIGRHINDLYREEFQSQYRDSVAHFVLTDGTTSSPSSHRESSRYARIVLLAQICTRELIQSQENYFRQFFSAGGHLC